MKRVSFVVFAVTIGLLALAVAATDFSGTYVRDNSKSDPMMGGGRRGEGGPPPVVEVTLTIKQAANTFDVTTKRGDRTTEAKYTLDGKENKNTMGRGELVTKSSWDGDKLVVQGSQKFTTPNGEMEMQLKEVYSLEGNVLTVTSTRNTPQGERTSKQVYNKQ